MTGKLENQATTIITTHGTDGACSAALLLQMYPKAEILITSARRIALTLDDIHENQEKLSTIYICRVIFSDNLEPVVNTLQSLRKKRWNAIWYCGRKYCLFAQFAKQEGITNESLLEAAARAEKGLVDADLGGGVIKQRIARPGQGMSGGYRSIILFRSHKRAFFVYGFAKGDQENISLKELKVFKEMAKEVMKYSDKELINSLNSGTLVEVKRNVE